MKNLRVRHERINKKWTLEYVARQIGITNQSVSLIETGQNNPSYGVVVKLENLFGLTHRELFEEVDMEKAQ